MATNSEENEATLITLVYYAFIGILILGIILIIITALTHSEIAYRGVEAILAPLPLWGFIAIIAAMLDELEA